MPRRAESGGSTKHKAVKRLKRIYKGSLTHSLNRQTACLLVPRMLVVEFLHPTICSKEREKQNLLEHAISISSEKSCKLIPVDTIGTNCHRIPITNCIIKLKFHSLWVPAFGIKSSNDSKFVHSEGRRELTSANGGLEFVPSLLLLRHPT